MVRALAAPPVSRGVGASSEQWLCHGRSLRVSRGLHVVSVRFRAVVFQLGTYA